jgi:Holliday junction resolvasome RuvABC endonuclease subunit
LPAIIAGIDPALDVTGIVLYRPDDGMYQSHIITSNYKGIGRLVDIRDSIIKLMIDIKFAAIEDYFFSDKYANAYELAELNGVIKSGLHEAGIRFIKVNPLQLKKYATGDSKATKDQIMLQSYKRWGVEFRTNHECDAYVLSKIGAAYVGYRKGLISEQKDVIAKLLNTAQ